MAGSFPEEIAATKSHRNLRRWTEPRWFAWSMLIAGAALYSLSFPPWNLALGGWLALFPWCWWAKRTLSWKTTFIAGYAMGILLLLLGIFWLGVLHPSFPVLVSSLEGVAFGLFLILLRILLRVLPAIMACPIAFLVLEWGRGRLPLDGFPFLTLGYSQAPFSTLIQISDLGGVYAVSTLMAVFAGALYDAYEAWNADSGRKRIAISLALGVLPIVMALGYGTYRRSTLDLDAEGQPTLIAVQGNIAQALKNDRLGSDDIFRQYLRLTHEALESSSQAGDSIVIWPETMFPYWLARAGEPGDVYLRVGDRVHDYESAKRLEEARLARDLAGSVLKPRGAFGLIGIKLLGGRTPESKRSYNSAVLIRPDGSRIGSVDKSILVPGGEYIPLLRALPDDWEEEVMTFIRRFAGFLPDLTPGDGPALLDIPKDGEPYRLGVTICYENVYPHYARDLAFQGADVLVNISNEAWYGDSAELDQMHDISIFRAIETRRSLVRATNTGVTASIDPLGRDEVLREGDRDREFEGYLITVPRATDATSLYVRFGDWLPGLGCILAAIFALRSAFSSRSVTAREGRGL